MRCPLVRFGTDGDMWNGAVWAIKSFFFLLGLIPFSQPQLCDYIQTVTECPLFITPPQFTKTFTSTLNTHPPPPPLHQTLKVVKKKLNKIPSGAGVRREQSGCKLHECTAYFDIIVCFVFLMNELTTQC